MSDCIGYTPKVWDYIVPPIRIFNSVCFSHDKTRMFLISIVRLAVYMGILFTVLDNNREKPKEIYKQIIYYLVTVCIIINISALLVIIIKAPKYPKKLDYPSTV